jgi:hypothetical protein
MSTPPGATEHGWTHKGQIWLLTLYSKAAADSIPGHVLKALKEEMVDEAL